MNFSRGSLLIDNIDRTIPDWIQYDSRIGSYRTLAFRYKEMKRLFPDIEDHVFNDEIVNVSHDEKLRSYQRKAIEVWTKNDYGGVVVLPTAAGKTHIGIEAIGILRTTTIVIAPTIELVQQWRKRLEDVFGVRIGQIGGGVKEIEDISVATYDSAYLMAETLGNRFEFLLADEVHHMASQRYMDIARMYASPYRLGLTATFERIDMLHEDLEKFMGGKIFELGYDELSEYLSNYEIIRIPVELEQEEEEEYEKNHDIFISYLRRHRITMRGPWDFQKFIMSSWNPEGREALMAWRKARKIAFNARVKKDIVRYVLNRHRGEKTLIFSDDTESAYMISREFLIPCITYLTPGPERKMYLDMFRSGKVRALTTSRVLDEGIDVPDASVGIVLSGSGSSRQFRQRLGRILRPGDGKKAVMYEIVARGTSEYGTSKRRRKGVPVSIDDDKEE